MDIRRLVIVKDTIHAEGGLPAVQPVTRVAACAVIGNPLAGQATDELEVLLAFGAELGERLVKEALAALPGPPVAYGKGRHRRNRRRDGARRRDSPSAHGKTHARRDRRRPG